MRLPKRGERGFTLIELLIVVAILGVLAAVVIPNVTRFVGSGEEEAAETELHNVQLAVTSMMLENGLTSIPNPVDVTSGGVTNQMAYTATPAGGFPDNVSSWVVLDDPLEGKVTDPNGDAYAVNDQPGYVLFGHDMTGLGVAGPYVNYVTVAVTTHYYTCEADGTVQQWDALGNPLVWD